MNKSEQIFALCIENRDCEDLEKRKVYKIISDTAAENDGYIRIIDESGEDYLYPQAYFVLIKLPRKAQNAMGQVV
jgi:hypothetical protein